MSSGNSACGILHVSVTSNGGRFGSNISRVGLSTHVSDSLISVLVTPCQCRTFPVSSTHFMDSSFLVCGGHSLCQILTSWICLLSDTSRVGHSPCQVLTSWIRLFSTLPVSDTPRVRYSLHGFVFSRTLPVSDTLRFRYLLHGFVFSRTLPVSDIPCVRYVHCLIRQISL